MATIPEEEFLRKMHWRHFGWGRQPAVWLVAGALGTLVGYLVIAFRMLIDGVSSLAFGGTETTLFEATRELSGWSLVLTTTAGGLVVGLLIRKFLNDRRPGAIIDLIEARALHSACLEPGRGLVSALTEALALGVGASTGREGPAAHLGGTIASLVAQRLGYPARIARILLGAGVAAAVAASFNAPIAGVMFALEVVLGFYSARAFAPIVIASVAGALIVRLHIGDMPAFALPDFTIRSVLEVPLFAVLGMVSSVFAVVFIRSLHLGYSVGHRMPVPVWLKPGIGGLLVGLVALQFPEVLGVGYGPTDAALKGSYGLGFLAALIVAKTLATSLTFGFRLAGGVFSPSLFLGAMLGAAFGIVAGGLFPDTCSEVSVYAIVGMGAVSAAVLGAPISTTLIIFELTGDYGVMVALMIATSTATVQTQATLGGSFFQLVLHRRGHRITDGPQEHLQETIKVRAIMTEEIIDSARVDSADAGTLAPEDTLGHAIELFERTKQDALLVVDPNDPTRVVGRVDHKRALQVFNEALIEANLEEHR